jgi:type VI secretion system secreted protein Hcp
MQQRTDVASGLATGKATVRQLTIRKHVDKGSTALMSALRTNESIKEALLTIRKWGKSALEYLTIKIEEGRVVSVDIETDTSNPPVLVERVSFSFNKIKVEYTPQGSDGQAQGSTSFEDTWTASV